MDGLGVTGGVAGAAALVALVDLPAALAGEPMTVTVPFGATTRNAGLGLGTIPIARAALARAAGACLFPNVALIAVA